MLHKLADYLYFGGLSDSPKGPRVPFAMPNLKDVVDDPVKRRDSVERMMSGAYQRPEVAINHGVRNAAELDALVCSAPGTPENIAAYHRILDQQHDRQSQSEESA